MAPHGTSFRILGYIACYTVWIAIVQTHSSSVQTQLVDDFYAISGGVVGLWFTAYVGFVMSRWYDLTVATGTVSGCLTDIAMIMKSYLVQIDAKSMPRKEMGELVERLKIAHAYHVSELFTPDRVRGTKAVTELFQDTNVKHSGGLIPTLASILSLVTVVSEKLKFSDSVKFSLLPAVQQNISTIRARAGECTMILGTRFPPIFTRCMYLFLTIHLGYLPVYLSVKTGSRGTPLVSVLSLLGGALILSLSVICETHFRNPFKRNDFKLDHIVAYTFAAIDEVLSI